MAETTFCIWRRNGDPSWQTGQIEYPDEDDPDGSEDLLFILDGEPRTYQEFAEQYYERSIDLDTVTSVYEQRSLTPQMIEKLNPEVSLENVEPDLEEIDYLRSANLTRGWSGLAMSGLNLLSGGGEPLKRTAGP